MENLYRQKIIPTHQISFNAHTPRYDSSAKVIQKIIGLTERDFPQGRLHISINGSVKPKNF